MAVLLTLVLALPVLASPFADVPEGHWAYDAVNKLVVAGLVEGYPDGTFKGDRVMTRYQFAQVVARLVDNLESSIQQAAKDQAAAAMNAAQEAKKLAEQALSAAQAKGDNAGVTAAQQALDKANAAYALAQQAQAKAEDASASAKAAADAADAAKAKAEEALQKVAQLAGVDNAEALQTLKDLQARLDTLDQAIADKASNADLSDVKDTADSAQMGVDQIREDLKNYATLKDVEDTTKKLLEEFRNDVVSQGVTLKRVDDLTQALDGRVKALEDKVAGLEKQMADVNQRVANLEDRVLTLESQMAETNARVDAVNDAVNKAADLGGSAWVGVKASGQNAIQATLGADLKTTLNAANPATVGLQAIAGYDAAKVVGALPGSLTAGIAADNRSVGVGLSGSRGLGAANLAFGYIGQGFVAGRLAYGDDTAKAGISVLNYNGDTAAAVDASGKVSVLTLKGDYAFATPGYSQVHLGVSAAPLDWLTLAFDIQNIRNVASFFDNPASLGLADGTAWNLSATMPLTLANLPLEIYGQYASSRTVTGKLSLKDWAFTPGITLGAYAQAVRGSDAKVNITLGGSAAVALASNLKLSLADDFAVQGDNTVSGNLTYTF